MVTNNISFENQALQCTKCPEFDKFKTSLKQIQINYTPIIKTFQSAQNENQSPNTEPEIINKMLNIYKRVLEELCNILPENSKFYGEVLENLNQLSQHLLYEFKQFKEKDDTYISLKNSKT
jgi:hypothetical protein